MLPPEPSSTLTLLRNLCVTMGETAALSLIRLTRPRASANASRALGQPPVAAYAAPAQQHRQKCRRENKFSAAQSMASSLFVPVAGSAVQTAGPRSLLS